MENNAVIFNDKKCCNTHIAGRSIINFCRRFFPSIQFWAGAQFYWITWIFNSLKKFWIFKFCWNEASTQHILETRINGFRKNEKLDFLVNSFLERKSIEYLNFYNKYPNPKIYDACQIQLHMHLKSFRTCIWTSNKKLQNMYLNCKQNIVITITTIFFLPFKNLSIYFFISADTSLWRDLLACKWICKLSLIQMVACLIAKR